MSATCILGLLADMRNHEKEELKWGLRPWHLGKSPEGAWSLCQVLLNGWVRQGTDDSLVKLDKIKVTADLDKEYFIQMVVTKTQMRSVEKNTYEEAPIDLAL